MEESLIEQDVMSFLQEYNLTQHAHDAGFLSLEGSQNTTPSIEYYPSYSSLSRNLIPETFSQPVEPSDLTTLNVQTTEVTIEEEIPVRSKPVLRRGSRDGGLKAISKAVYDLVARKGKVKLTDVADYVVSLYTGITPSDEQNIRRRVYDAVNVLNAIEIMKKDSSSREISWVGLPSNTRQDLDRTNLSIQDKKIEIEKKRKELSKLVLQYVNTSSVIARNKRRKPPIEKKHYVKTPFVLFNTEETRERKIDFSFDSERQKLSISMPPSSTKHSSSQVITALHLGASSEESGESGTNPLSELSPDVVSYIPALNMSQTLDREAE